MIKKSLIALAALPLLSGCQTVEKYVELETRRINYSNQQLCQKYHRSGDIVPIRISENELWVNFKDEGLESVIVEESGAQQAYSTYSRDLTKIKDFYWLRLAPIGNDFTISINNRNNTLSETFTEEKIKDSYAGEYGN